MPFRTHDYGVKTCDSWQHIARYIQALKSIQYTQPIDILQFHSYKKENHLTVLFRECDDYGMKWCELKWMENMLGIIK